MKLISESVKIKILNSKRVMTVFEIITVGYPFCGFKIIAGLTLSQAHTSGMVLVLLGITDLLINTLNLAGLIVVKRRLFHACTISQILSIFKRTPLRPNEIRENLGNSLDLFLSFLLVVFMIAAGKIPTLSQGHLHLWNLSVILNVLGAGLIRLKSSLFDYLNS